MLPYQTLLLLRLWKINYVFFKSGLQNKQIPFYKLALRNLLQIKKIAIYNILAYIAFLNIDIKFHLILILKLTFYIANLILYKELLIRDESAINHFQCKTFFLLL
jgi:hypothetical protein